MILFKYKNGDFFERRYYIYQNTEKFFDRNDGQEIWYFVNNPFVLGKTEALSGTYKLVKQINENMYRKHHSLIKDII